MVIRAEGIINFKPENRTRKHEAQHSWKKTALIETDCDLERYYAWFIERRFNLKLNQTLRGTHISFINDRFEHDDWNRFAAIFDGKPITFFYELEPRSDAKHWWLRVHSPEAESIREICGLTRVPYFGLHLTLGYANEKNIEHSEYILNQCKRFGLISSETRKPLEQHQIIDPYGR
jgi:hypothetical protein